MIIKKLLIVGLLMCGTTVFAQTNTFKVENFCNVFSELSYETAVGYYTNVPKSVYIEKVKKTKDADLRANLAAMVNLAYSLQWYSRPRDMERSAKSFGDAQFLSCYQTLKKAQLKE